MTRNLTRLDANEGIFLARQLESIDPTEYFTLYAGLMGRRYIPLIENVNEWQSVYTYRMFEVHGEAKIGAPSGHAKDHRNVSVSAKEYSRTIKEIPVVYGWTVREIQQAAATNMPLDRLTVQAAMAAVARKIDNMLAFGEPGSDISGLLNDPSVEATNIVVATTKAAGGTTWAVATAQEILNDITLLISATRQRLKMASELPGGSGLPVFDRYTILVPSVQYGQLVNMVRATGTDTTLLKFLLLNNPWIESIEEWYQLDTADPSGGARIVAYPRNPLALGGLVPSEFRALPHQEVGHDIVIPASGMCGGTVIRYPVGVSYMDNV